MPDPYVYRSLAGSLQYLSFTRPDLAFAINQLCQHMHQPSTANFTALKRVLRYIKGTLGFGIHLTKGSLCLQAFSDADWAGDQSDRRSTSGFCVFLGNSPVSWSAKKQPTVAHSSTEAEYRGLAHTSAELSFLRMLVKDLCIFLPSCPLIWCDSVSDLSLASNPVFHARTKHIEVDYHFVREKVLRRDLFVRYVSSDDNVADIFTKGLYPRRFAYLIGKLKVVNSPLSLRGPVSKTQSS